MSYLTSAFHEDASSETNILLHKKYQNWILPEVIDALSWLSERRNGELSSEAPFETFDGSHEEVSSDEGEREEETASLRSPGKMEEYGSAYTFMQVHSSALPLEKVLILSLERDAGNLKEEVAKILFGLTGYDSSDWIFQIGKESMEKGILVRIHF
jgi:hypothetical protein